ncbi:hypothetical protein SCHPADRAFT_834780 [Schizopora paradoxa]|uniref:MYND-type domain-containing protein n=1 Tax=Schizopora paradoxa TaxID=27342 RepID=A0A0H2RBP5_9AGAM|nr:hypothetical protein SCHPADRAFT_834780 [Schizopora paradoxa]
MEQTNKEDSGSDTQACPICDAPAVNRCSRCASVYYCSQEHQKEVRYESPSNALIPKESGTKFTVDAILFPVDEDRPRIIQMGFTYKRQELVNSPGEYEDIHYFDSEYLRKYLKTPFLGNSFLFQQSSRGEPIPDGASLHIVHNDTFMQDGSKVNQCIRKLTNGMSVHVIDWRDNVIVLRKPKGRKPGLPSETVSNIEEQDMRYILNYFMGY